MLRREFVASAALAGMTLGRPRPGSTISTSGASMYGLIGKMTAVVGERDALAAILLAGTQEMPGCLSYIIATDPSDSDGLWITEVWETAEHHAASLQLPSVKEAIAKGRPLIAGFSNRTETIPIGGHGLMANQR